MMIQLGVGIVILAVGGFVYPGKVGMSLRQWMAVGIILCGVGLMVYGGIIQPLTA